MLCRGDITTVKNKDVVMINQHIENARIDNKAQMIAVDSTFASLKSKKRLTAKCKAMT